MYEILENPQRMSREEVYEKYDGKWLFIIHLEGEPFQPWETGIPVVVADSDWEGDDEGIYDVYYDDPSITRLMHLSLIRDENFFFGFWELPLD